VDPLGSRRPRRPHATGRVGHVDDAGRRRAPTAGGGSAASAAERAGPNRQQNTGVARAPASRDTRGRKAPRSRNGAGPFPGATPSVTIRWFLSGWRFASAERHPGKPHRGSTARAAGAGAWGWDAPQCSPPHHPIDSPSSGTRGAREIFGILCLPRIGLCRAGREAGVGGVARGQGAGRSCGFCRASRRAAWMPAALGSGHRAGRHWTGERGQASLRFGQT
jgi:hypothetical protein